MQNTYLNKRKQREFATKGPALQEMLKDPFQAEDK